jgi:hypothetical protein
VHVWSDLSRVAPDAFQRIVRAGSDPHPRVRAEAVRALSYFQTEASVDALLKIVENPMDPWLSYIAEHAIAATQSTWEPMYKSGELAKKSPKGIEAVDRFLASNGPGIAAEKHMPMRPLNRCEATQKTVSRSLHVFARTVTRLETKATSLGRN